MRKILNCVFCFAYWPTFSGSRTTHIGMRSGTKQGLYLLTVATTEQTGCHRWQHEYEDIAVNENQNMRFKFKRLWQDYRQYKICFIIFILTFIFILYYCLWKILPAAFCYCFWDAARWCFSYLSCDRIQRYIWAEIWMK